MEQLIWDSLTADHPAYRFGGAVIGQGRRLAHTGQSTRQGGFVYCDCSLLCVLLSYCAGEIGLTDLPCRPPSPRRLPGHSRPRPFSSLRTRSLPVCPRIFFARVGRAPGKCAQSQARKKYIASSHGPTDIIAAPRHVSNFPTTPPGYGSSVSRPPVQPLPTRAGRGSLLLRRCVAGFVLGLHAPGTRS